MQKEEKIATNRSPAVFGRGDTGVRHVGLYARDPAATAEFYREVMGMQIVGGSSADHPLGASAFLTSGRFFLLLRTRPAPTDSVLRRLLHRGVRILRSLLL